jgi:hypothetical protein
MSILKTNQITDLGGNNIISSDGSGTFTQTFASNTPMFSVYGNGTTVGNNSYTKIVFENEVYDTDTAFGSNKFTVPSGKAGYYFFNLVITPDNGVTFTDWRVRLYKNGSSGGLANGFFNFISDTKSASGDFPTVTGSCVVNLAEGDYIEVYGFHNSGSNRTFNWPFFQGHRLIGA